MTAKYAESNAIVRAKQQEVREIKKNIVSME